MRNGNRKFFREEVMHVYQRAINGFNIFYTLEDRLVFYTIFSVFLRRFNITALALCLMIDHFHALLICGSRQTFYKFVSSVTSLYSRLFNESVSRKGRLFDKSFGSAPKMGEKQVRSAIPYLFNNPVLILRHILGTFLLIWILTTHSQTGYAGTSAVED